MSESSPLVVSIPRAAPKASQKLSTSHNGSILVNSALLTGLLEPEGSEGTFDGFGQDSPKARTLNNSGTKNCHLHVATITICT